MDWENRNQERPMFRQGKYSPWFPVNFMVPSNSLKKKLQFSAFFNGLANPDANHRAGIFTYMTGSFLGFLCRQISQHHGSYGKEFFCSPICRTGLLRCISSHVCCQKLGVVKPLVFSFHGKAAFPMKEDIMRQNTVMSTPD